MPWTVRAVHPRFLLALLVVPLAVALVALAWRDWHPVLDLAMTELRVRDVGGPDTPLIGLPGRIGRPPDHGSHPGPVSFYVLAPVYRLAGSTSWGLELGAALVHCVAIGLALWIARRCGGPWAVLAAAAALALLARGYGPSLLTQPWNPYLPLLCWIVVLLAVWAVLRGDHAMIVVVAAAATFGAQTHVPYLGLGAGMALLAIVALLVGIARAEAARRRAALRSLTIAVGVTVVAWMPPLVDQLRHEPGNLRLLVEYFGDPPEATLGWADAVGVLVRRLDAWRLIGLTHGAGHLAGAGASAAPGAVTIALWALAVATAWQMRHGDLLRLHAVIAWAVALAVVSISRIFGEVWFYLTLWAWGIAAAMLVATVWTFAAWTFAVWLPRRRAGEVTAAAVPVVRTALIVVVAMSTVVFAVRAATVDPPEAAIGDIVGAVAPATAAALDSGVGAADGRGGRYQVAWNDGAFIGSPGYGLLDELERRGFDVGVPAVWGVPATLHRVRETADATAIVMLATGVHVDEWRRHPDAVQVAAFDPRDDAERAEYAALRQTVIDELTSARLDDLVEMVDLNLFGLGIDERLPSGLRDMVERMSALGQETAVFVVPPGSL